MKPMNDNVTLSWHRQDIEQRLGFHGGKHTNVNHLLAFIGGGICVGLIYILLIFGIRESNLAIMFLDRPSRLIPFMILFFSAWCLVILALKYHKINLQSKALDIQLLPDAHDFSLAPATAPALLRTLHQYTDNPSHFVLLSRVERALANLSNIGRVSDVVSMLHAQAENDEDQMESSYTMLRGFIWGIPVIGFIGTVLGLSMSIGSFGAVLAQVSDISKITDNLREVTAGLSTAFETTLQGLVAALTIQLLMASIKRKEEVFLDACKEFCHKNIISRLKLISVDDASHEF